MTNSKYTPGPWIVRPDLSIETGQSGITVAGLVDMPADAHLIAAAPAMYEALSDVPLPSCNGDKAEWYARFYAWYCGARQAALAQAEGRDK